VQRQLEMQMQQLQDMFEAKLRKVKDKNKKLFNTVVELHWKQLESQNENVQQKLPTPRSHEKADVLESLTKSTLEVACGVSYCDMAE